MPPRPHSEPLSSFFPLLPLLFLLLLSFLVPNAAAVGISFTTPGAGATWPAGPITVKWIDAGGSPDMAALDTYTLQLVVGGNEAGNSDVVATIGGTNGRVADGQVAGEIAADVAQSVENGFYFKMTSTTTDRNSVINYSYRFTLINMNGTTSSSVLDGANAAKGTDDVPAAQYNVVARPTPSPSSPSSAAATATVTTVAATDALNRNNDDVDNGGDGLSVGLKIGIGVGVVFALMGAASIFVWAFMLYRHKQRRRHERAITFDKDHESASAPGVVSQFGKAELPAHSATTSQSTLPTELSPLGARYQLSGHARPVEAARASIYELDSGWDGWEAGSTRKSMVYDPTNVI